MQGVKHVVLEVDAPVHKGSEADEADGFVTCDGGVYDVAYAGTVLTVVSGSGQDTCRGIGNCGATYSLEAYGLETMGLTTLHVCEVL